MKIRELPDDAWKEEWRLRSLVHGGHRTFATDTSDAVVGRSCLHCRRQPEEHQEGKCLFDATTYEPYGPERVGELLRKKAAWYAEYIGSSKGGEFKVYRTRIA